MLPSLSVYIGNKLIFRFDSTSLEITIAPPSDGSGSISNHLNIRPDIRQHWHYGH